MKLTRWQRQIPLLLATAFCGGSLLIGGQTGQKPAAAEDCGCDETPSGPQLWATANGTKIFDTDLKDALAAQVDPLLKRLKEIRQQGLEDLINSRLIDKEAKAQGMPRVEFLRIQVDSKLQPPSDADIQKWINENRTRLNRDPAAPDFRRDVALFLKDQGRINAIRALGLQLRKKSEVHILPETTNTEPQRVVAMLDGQPIRRSDLDEFTKAQVYDVRKQIHEIRKQALDRKIYSVLMEKEAARRGMTSQRLQSVEVLDKAPLVTAEQADAFYAANKSQIPQPLEAVRTNIIVYLRQQAVAKEEERFSAELRKGATITVSLPGVTEPVFTINTQGRPTTGPKDAPVTIVEFTDYECPRCGEIQPVIKGLLAMFPGRVRLVVREFPLTRHAFARKAAQAAECALEQGKYWEYSELLFKNQAALDEASLLRHATTVGMDKTLLAAHLKDNRHDRVVQEDLDEGLQVGVGGTPAFYINGKPLDDRTSDAMKAAIERALAAPKN